MTMTHVWDYRDTLGRTFDANDLVGYDVVATDGSIGKIDAASTETDRRYLVVDTGFWIFGKKRLIPAGVVSDVDHGAKNVFVSMTKDQIKSAPDLDERWMPTDDYDYESHGRYYRDYGW